MPRYIDADSLYQKINGWRKQIKTTCGERDDYVECLGEVLTFIGSEPNADVVEIVRCKDCKYSVETDKYERWCYGFCQPARLVRSDDYCSHGKKEKPDER